MGGSEPESHGAVPCVHKLLAVVVHRNPILGGRGLPGWMLPLDRGRGYAVGSGRRCWLRLIWGWSISFSRFLGF